MSRGRARRRGAVSNAADPSRTGPHGPAPDGVLVIDKPEGPTSHDVVESARRALGTRAGHTGTLDPLATGVLPLVLGKATRLSRFYQNQDKEYLARIGLGRTTETYDREGAMVREGPVPELSTREVREFLDRFVGEIPQRPPLYSAVRVQGRRLYELARSRQSGEPPLRQVRIHGIELLERTRDEWALQVHCSAGTYIRTLAHDLGEAIGCGAFLVSLRRTRSGAFDLSQAISPERMKEEWESAHFPLEKLLPELPLVELEDAEGRLVRHGGQVQVNLRLPDGWCRVFHRGRLVALGETDAGTIQPSVVLDPL